MDATTRQLVSQMAQKRANNTTLYRRRRLNVWGFGRYVGELANRDRVRRGYVRRHYGSRRA